ncbi:crotonase/enoyl-CoA hydratase family protein [Sphingomonas sp. MAH-20]|uniref:Crotonase/enoyl-CoA hydratase family protein n=1 Tax=Sphingomonas horti TaxID=2682842 RepID=A0A6I4IWM1_9SPHN|nr:MULTISPECIES: crotonase/enoyl-CoA hydratase family protein [Sphingomonas]MBA2920158.1 crotonase/enoyl-CoA hydratase family protein [Sphingomonas sp. CGMCC 1.13658]MVO76413.1 crotonase/enoyl-CoA hydratase family protein [Sphingomonas horti]
MTDPILCARNGAVLTVTLNLPDKRNPISDPLVIDALEQALLAADSDIGVRAVILTGAGTAFSSGGDLKAMKAGRGLRAPLPAQTRRNYREGIQRLPLLFHALEVPVIAAINGPAIGAGLDLACMCDIRIAAETAVFAESFVKIGIVPGDGGAWLLPRIVGFSRATELALTGETIGADEALRIGLVSRVVPAGELMAAARAVADRIAANPPHAVRMTRRLLREGQTATLANILEMSAAMQSLAHATRDNDEAIDAFIEKRAPRFTGE